MEGPGTSIPPRLGPYVLGELLGRGGMGAVYRARDERLGREVALKLMLPDGGEEEVYRKRFLREMRAQASLSHPNVVKVLDVGAEGDLLYFVMELLAGRTLRTCIEKDGVLSTASVISIGIALARALAELHAHRMIHRDIKPQNVIVQSDGRPVLMDLGLVKVVNATVITQVGTVVGTPRYLAPEVLLGAPGDAQTDVYQLGLLLYEAATGRPAFGANTVQALVREVLAGKVVRPIAVRPAIGPALDETLLWMIARERAQRAPDAPAVAVALERLRDGKRIGARGAASPGPASPGPALATVSPGSAHTPMQVGGGGALSPRPILASAGARERSAPPGTARRLAVRGTAFLGLLALAVLLEHLGRPWTHVAARVVMSVEVATPSARASARQPVPASAASIRADAASRPPGPESLSGCWRALQVHLPWLEAGGPPAERAVRTLRKESPIDFGSTPDPWIRWILLSRWLAHPVGPWPPPGHQAVSRVSALNPDYTRFFLLQAIRGFKSVLTPDLIIDAFNTIDQVSFDGRPWLLLGRVLELDGEEQEARTAYKTALERLGDAPFEAPSLLVWVGLARALMLSGDPGRLEKEWPVAMKHQPSPEIAWHGLREALEETGGDREVYLRLLRQAAPRDRRGDMAYVQLGDFFERGDLGAPRDPDRALHTWIEGQQRYPASEDLSFSLFLFHLYRGDIDSAEALCSAIPKTSAWRTAIAVLRCEDGSVAGAKPPTVHGAPTFEWLGVRAFRLLEMHQLGPADPAFLPTRDVLLQPDEQAWLEFESLAAGSATTDTVQCCDQLLLGRRFRWRQWWQAAGILSTTPGIAAMRGYLARGRVRWPAEPRIDLAEALWLSRRDRHREALDLLGRIDRPDGAGARSLPASDLCEIVTRPLWESAVGFSVDTTATDWAHRLAPPDGDKLADGYWLACRAGDFDRAAELAGRLQWREPDDPFWGEVVVWNAARGKDRRQFDACLARARVIDRVNRPGLWPMRELAAIEKRFVGDGEKVRGRVLR